MKEMAKARIITKKSVTSVMKELAYLELIKSDFIVNVHFAFQDRNAIYLVMDLLLGGDLRYHIARRRQFSEEVTKFLIACLLHALEAVHSVNVIHRDIKPENLLLDNQGYLRLTDFGVACNARQDNSGETSGTPGYMAPEVMLRKNHGLAADYFAVGVIAYECMLGHRPYVGKNRREIRDQILSRQAQVKNFEIPVNWSSQSAEFINACLLRNPDERIGATRGTIELKSHAWFDGFRWDLLASKQLQSPIVPDTRLDNFDAAHVNNPEWKDAELVKEAEQQLRHDSVQKLFESYYYNKYEVKQPAPLVSTTKTAFTTGAENDIDRLSSVN